MLKKLEIHEYVKRIRDKNDERNVFIHLNNKGKELKNKAKDVPINMCNCIYLNKEEIQILQKLLYKLFKSEE